MYLPFEILNCRYFCQLYVSKAGKKVPHQKNKKQKNKYFKVTLVATWGMAWPWGRRQGSREEAGAAVRRLWCGPERDGGAWTREVTRRA